MASGVTCNSYTHTPSTHTHIRHTHTLTRPRTAREIRKILFPLMKYSPAAGQGLLDVWHHFYELPHLPSPPPCPLPAFRVMHARMQSGIKAHRENVATNVDIARQDHRESSKKCPQRSQLALRMLQFVWHSTSPSSALPSFHDYVVVGFLEAATKFHFVIRN